MVACRHHNPCTQASSTLPCSFQQCHATAYNKGPCLRKAQASLGLSQPASPSPTCTGVLAGVCLGRLWRGGLLRPAAVLLPDPGGALGWVLPLPQQNHPGTPQPALWRAYSGGSAAAAAAGDPF